MILDRFFKPKWQHRDAHIRRRAMQALPDGAKETVAILEQAAVEDSDADIRRMAIKRLDNLAVMDRALGDKDESVVEAAKQRLQQLLCGKLQSGPELGQRIARVQDMDDEKMLEYLLKQGVEPGLRLAALNKLNRESLFGDIAVKDPDPEVRLAAVNRIQRKSTLDRVYKAAKGKDKKVSQIAKERLDVLEQEEQRPQMLLTQARQICLALETMHRVGDWRRADIQLATYQNQWNEVHEQWRQAALPEFDAALKQRFETALQTAQQSATAHQEQQMFMRAEEAKRDPIRARKRDILTQCEDRLLQLESAPLDEEKYAQLAQDIDQWQAQWSTVEALPPEEEKPMNSQFQQAVKRLRACAQDFQVFSRYQKQLENLLRQADAVDPARVTPAQVDKLKQQKNQLPAPIKRHDEGERESRLNTRLTWLENKAAENEAARIAQKHKLIEMIDQFIKTAESGRVAQCHKIKRDIQTLLGQMNKADQAEVRRLNVMRQYQDALQRFNELSNWRAWASTPVKQHLVEEVETLAQEVKDQIPQDFNSLAQYIRDKREEWKKIGQSEAEDETQLWERFNTACNTVYEFCRQCFHEQSETRKVNKESKMKICHDLEAVVAKLDADHTDWNWVEKIIETARMEWRAVGPVDRKFNQELNDRFAKVLDAFKNALTGHRENARLRKETLIKKAEAIAMEIHSSKNQEQDIREAVNHIKNAQNEWKNVGRASKERELWKQFRTFCDAVFNLREELHEKRDTELVVNLQRKQQLLADMQALLRQEPFETKQANAKMQQYQTQWDETGRVPRAEDKVLQQTLNDIRKQFEGKKATAQAEEKRAHMHNLQAKAQACLQLEGYIGAHAFDAAVLEQARVQWSQFPSLDSKLEPLMQKRFDTAVAILNGEDKIDGTQWLAGNQAKKSELCLRAEILTGAETPPAYQDQRMQYQVALLAGKLSGATDTGGSKRSQMEDILTQWYSTGRAADETELNLRFESAMRRGETE